MVDKSWMKNNALRFSTKEEAEKYIHNLMMRWMAVRKTRVIESPDKVNYKWVEGKGAVGIK